MMEVDGATTSGTYPDHSPGLYDLETLTGGSAIGGRPVEAVFLGLISLTALVGNISLWFIVCYDASLRSPTNALILALSAADILVSSNVMPVMVATLATGEWMLGSVACQFLGFVSMVTFVDSVLSLGVISINRYVLVCRPQQVCAVYTAHNVALMIAGESDLLFK